LTNGTIQGVATWRQRTFRMYSFTWFFMNLIIILK